MNRERLALVISVTLHSILGAWVIHRFSEINAPQIQIETIEMITDSPPQAPVAAVAKKVQDLPQNAPPAKAPTPAPVTATGTETSPVNGLQTIAAFNTYLAAVRDKLSQSLHLPTQRYGPSLRAVLKVTLLEDGGVKNPSIAVGSGSAEFDQQILEALERARPFPPFSKEMASRHEVTIRLPVELRARR